MTTRVQAPAVTDGAGQAPGADAAPRSRVDCVADSAGGLTFDVYHEAGTEQVDHGGGALVLRPRDLPAAEETRLPLATAGDGRVRAALPSMVALPEGRWDLHIAGADGVSQPLAPGVNDLRSLVDRSPGASVSPLAVRIPYTNKDGHVSLRSWLRSPHAEAGEVRVEESAVTVHGRLHRVADPANWLAGSVVQARLRGDARQVYTVPVRTEGADFSFTVSYAELADRWTGRMDLWDLWLVPDGAERGDDQGDDQGDDGRGGAVRVARLLDDVAEKKPVFVYPVRLVDAPGGAARSWPYYTVDNDLSVRFDAR